MARAALVARGELAHGAVPARGAHARALDARGARLDAVAVARLLRAVGPGAAGGADARVVELGRAEAHARAVGGARVHGAVGAAVAGEAHARGRLLAARRRHAVAVLAAPALAGGHLARVAREARAAVAGAAAALAVAAALGARHARGEGHALGRRGADGVLAVHGGRRPREGGGAGVLAQLLELRARAAPLGRLDGRLAAALGAQVDLARRARARARAVAATLDAAAVQRARAAVGRPPIGQARVGADALLARGAAPPRIALALPRHGRRRAPPAGGHQGKVALVALARALGAVLAEQAAAVPAAVARAAELGAVRPAPAVLARARAVDAHAVAVAAVGAERVLAARPVEARLAVAGALVAQAVVLAACAARALRAVDVGPALVAFAHVALLHGAAVGWVG